MTWLRVWLSRFMGLFRKRRLEQDLDEDVLTHIEMLTEEYRQKGMTPEEARYAALRAFGGVEQAKEECRDAWGVRIIEELVKDIQYGLRQLRRNPGFTVVSILSLALGIGATTAIFSVVNGILLKPLPYPHQERLIEVRQRYGSPTPVEDILCAAFYFVFRQQSHTLEDIGIHANTAYSKTVTGSGPPENVWALPVTDGLLPVLGVSPLLGRSFTRADDQPGSPDTVMLTYGFWRSKFAGDRSVIGRTVDVDGEPRVIIGVLPRRFDFLGMTNLSMLLPIKISNAEPFQFWYNLYGGIARLKPGVTLAEARADLDRTIPIAFLTFPLPPGWPRLAPEALEGMIRQYGIGASVHPLKQQVVGDVGKVLWVLVGGISLVLIIACMTVANLLLVRIEGRRQELALRVALGASRGRIAAELFSESLILAVLGGLLGLGLAYGALRVLLAMAPKGLPRLNEIGIDWTVVVFTIAVSIAASLLCGSVPLFRYAGADPGIRLREGGRSMSESRERHRSRSMLVIVEVALALVLLISSGLMIRTFHALTSVNPGFAAPSGVQTFRVSIPSAQVENPERVIRIEEEIADKIGALPGVSSVGISLNVPMDGNGWSGGVVVKDHVYSPNEAVPYLYGFFAPGFLQTVGTPIMAGRDFTWSDTYNRSPVAMVSESFAREYWHDPASAVGKQIRTGPNDEWREVVGVVADVYQDGVYKQAPDSVYFPILMDQVQGDTAEAVRRNVAFAIRSPRAGSESLMNEVRRAVWSVDPNLALFDVHTLDYYYTTSMARTSFTLVMLVIAGGMALLLGVLGLYGVIAYSVSQRTHEIGIRMALGAQKRDMLRLVLTGGMSLTMIGVGIGIPVALALTRFLSNLLYGVKPNDPLTFVAVSVVLSGVALLACYVPARRATKVDPMVALRHE